MDDMRFDRLAKSLSRGGTRRTILRGMIGAVGAMVVAPVRRGEAAICTMAGEYCNADSECCVGTCTLGMCRCPAGKVNCNGYCRDNCEGCPVGWRKCNGICRDLKTDAKHCGTCGISCPKGSHCSNGKCCGTGQVNCGGVCVPFSQCI